MIIYKLTSSKTDQVYVGKTVNLENRLKCHLNDYKQWLNGKHHFISSYFMLDYDDVKIEAIEKTNNSLREIYWLRKLNSCNFEFNGPNYFIYQLKDKKMKLGFIYVFEIRRKKRIVQKRSSNLEFLKKFRDDFIKNNQYLFIE